MKLTERMRNLEEFVNELAKQMQEDREKVNDLEKLQRAKAGAGVGIPATEDDLKKLSLAMHDWEVSIFKKYSGSQ